MFVTCLLVVVGLVILLGSGAFTIRGAVSLARCLGVSPLVIGMTVVAFGTSAPELMVSVQAVLSGHPDIVLGNVVGSNVANILLIVGVAAAITVLFVPEKMSQRRDYAALLVFTVVFVGICCFGEISSLVGGLMLFGLIGYTIWSFRSARRSQKVDEANLESSRPLDETPLSVWTATLFTGIGIVGVIVGAYLLLEGSVDLARMWGVSEAVIGLTVIAIGTSLPELATSTMAAMRGHPGLAIGNVMGSNLFNMFGITGLSAAVAAVPLQVPDQVVGFDLWVMLGSTILICIILSSGWRIVRLAGAGMITLYVLYILVQFRDSAIALAG